MKLTRLTNQMDKISIVVAIYNAEKYLKKCIDSLLNQTYKNTEIILVNDCSDDLSLNICKEYSSKYANIYTINNEKNLGVSAARNNGIDVSTGDYICFVDSDDYVEPNYLETLYYYYKKYNTVPICGFVYHDEYNHCRPVEYRWSGGNELVSLGKAFKLNDELYLTALWNKLFDKRLVQKHNIRFDVNVSMGEDLRFTVDYLQKTNEKNVYAFSDTLYHYTKLTNATLMSQFSKQGIQNGVENLESIKELASKFNAEAEKVFIEKVEKLKNNIIYFIVRDKNYSNKEKIIKIREIKPEYSRYDFVRDEGSWLKERIASFLMSFNRRK